MRKIFLIFKDDLLSIYKNKIALILIIGLMIMPGIYAWTNIISNWNPYDNTKNLPVAVVNEDTGAEILGKNVNAGDMIVDKLKDNDAMKWQFTDDENEAIDGVMNGKYYASLIVPSNFTYDMTTIFSNDIKKPTLNYYINEKKNPVASIITGKAISSLQTELNKAFANVIAYNIADKIENIEQDRDLLQNYTSIDDPIKILEKSKDELGQVSTTLNSLNKAADSSSKMIDVIIATMPDVKNILKDSNNIVKNTNDIVSSFKGLSDNVSSNLEAITNSVNSLTNTLVDIVSKISSVAQKDINAAISLLNQAKNTCQNIKQINSGLIGVLNELKTVFPNLADLIDKQIESLNAANETIDNLVSDIDNAIQSLNTTGQISNELAPKIISDALKVQNLQNKIYLDLKGQVLPQLNIQNNATCNVLSNISSVLISSQNIIDGSNNALKNMQGAIDNTGDIVAGVNQQISSAQEDIDKIIDTISKISSSELYIKTAQMFTNSPDKIADFITSPVDTNVEKLYPISSYGSQLAPFFTSLAIWVGCTLLSAILMVDVKKKHLIKNTKLYQLFFGRYFIFATIAMLQGLTVGLGDLLMIRIYCVHPIAFLLTCVISSIIFSMIIYSLTVSFGKLGEALAVIMLVFQVAGSGGTFPVEILPRAFQNIQPFMPFYPALSAMRETIAGYYGFDYLRYILILMCHLILPLLLGLVLRKPIIRLKEIIGGKLEKCEIII